MLVNRTFLAAAACSLGLSLVACGGGDDDGTGTVTPEGTHYGYVVSKAYIPTTQPQVNQYALDIAAARSGTPDGVVDNQIGALILGLATTARFDIQGTLDTAVNTGSIILLADFQTTDFTSANASGLSIKIGANPVPAACTDPTDEATCGQHLQGTGMFSISTESPPSARVAGAITGGTFNGGPGAITLQIALGSTTPIDLSLLNARVKATAITADKMTAVIGGAVTAADIQTNVIPAVAQQVNSLLMVCGANPADRRAKTNCGCEVGSTQFTLLGILDTEAAADTKCEISAAEIANAGPVKAFLAPDVCSKDSCAAADAVSIGIKVDAVKATFPF